MYELRGVFPPHIRTLRPFPAWEAEARGCPCAPRTHASLGPLAPPGGAVVRAVPPVGSAAAWYGPGRCARVGAARAGAGAEDGAMSALSGRDGWRCEYGDGGVGTGMGMWGAGILGWAVLRYHDAPALSSTGQGTGMSPAPPEPEVSSPADVLPRCLFLPSRQISSGIGMSIHPAAQMLSTSSSPPAVPPPGGDALQHWDVPTPSTPGQGCPPALGCSCIIIPCTHCSPKQGHPLLLGHHHYHPVRGHPPSTRMPPWLPGRGRPLQYWDTWFRAGAPAQDWCPRGGGAQLAPRDGPTGVARGSKCPLAPFVMPSCGSMTGTELLGDAGDVGQVGAR